MQEEDQQIPNPKSSSGPPQVVQDALAQDLLQASLAGHSQLEDFLKIELAEPGGVKHWSRQQIADDAMAYLKAFNSSRKIKTKNRLTKIADIFLNHRYRPLCAYCGGEYAAYAIEALESGVQNCKHCEDAGIDADRDAFIDENANDRVWISLTSAEPPRKIRDWATEATRNWRVAEEG